MFKPFGKIFKSHAYILLMDNSQKIMRIQKHYYSKHIYYDQSFKDILDMFEKMVEKDKNILNSIPEKLIKLMRKNGLLSFGIKYLIKQYVNTNKTNFLNKNV